ncbi:FixH family protein [Robertmurraya korlensis]|uniref:FixH family protein n=1 Tax=Robertmurraya korlensis TaxID=519977 RepID=UPI000824682C|nr:FixH family protein [Robertmurraya korlensis]
MKKGLLVTVFTVLIMSLTACVQEEEEAPQFLDVKLSITPEHAEKGETVLFESKVTYGEENVTDADEVAFEIWRSNDENHEKIEVEHKENGVYSLEKTFDVDGTYYVYAHVTARSMHNMPKKEFVVGTASDKEEGSSSSMMDEEEDHSGH